MNKPNKVGVLFAVISVFFCCSFNPGVVIASGVDAVTNSLNYIQNSSDAVNTVSDARKDVVSSELEQQLKASGRWDDAQSLISTICASGDTQCAGKIMGYYASLNEVSNPDSSFRQSVGNAVDLNSSAEDFGVSAVASPVQEIFQPPVWVGVLNWLQDIYSGTKYFFSNPFHTGVQKAGSNETGANISVAINQLKQPQTSNNQPANSPTTLPSAKIITNWKLISGDPNDTCTTPTYSGEVQVGGWYESESSEEYGQTWVLRIAEEGARILPLYDYSKKINNDFNSTLTLANPSPELENQLKKASAKNPYTITLKGYKLYCEGNPVVSQTEFKPISEAVPTPAATAPTPTPPAITLFTIIPNAPLQAGQTSMLSWTATGATSLSIDNGIGDVSSLQWKIVSPTQTTTYTLTATNAVGSVTKQVTVTVNPAPPAQQSPSY